MPSFFWNASPAVPPFVSPAASPSLSSTHRGTAPAARHRWFQRSRIGGGDAMNAPSSPSAVGPLITAQTATKASDDDDDHDNNKYRSSPKAMSYYPKKKSNGGNGGGGKAAMWALLRIISLTFGLLLCAAVLFGALFVLAKSNTNTNTDDDSDSSSAVKRQEGRQEDQPQQHKKKKNTRGADSGEHIDVNDDTRRQNPSAAAPKTSSLPQPATTTALGDKHPPSQLNRGGVGDGNAPPGGKGGGTQTKKPLPPPPPHDGHQRQRRRMRRGFNPDDHPCQRYKRRNLLQTPWHPPQPKAKSPITTPTSTTDGMASAGSNVSDSIATPTPPTTPSPSPSNTASLLAEGVYRRLPTCMMPSMRPARPSGTMAWRRWYKRNEERKQQLAGKSVEGNASSSVPPPIKIPSPPKKFWEIPGSFSFFRPPYYGQEGLTFNGSMPFEDMFVHYDEAEWTEYCDIISGKKDPIMGGWGAEGGGEEEEEEVVGDDSDGSTPSSSSTYYNRLIIPDKVLYFINDQVSSWEEESLIGQFTPALFIMDRRQRLAEEEEEEMSEEAATRPASAPIIDDGGVRKHEKASSVPQKEQEQQQAEREAKEFPIVFTIFLRHWALLEKPKQEAADMAATIACLREHLLMWYDEDVVDRVFMSHEHSKAFMIENDWRTLPSTLKETFNTYEMVRRGDWLAVTDTTTTTEIIALDEKGGRHRIQHPIYEPSPHNADQSDRVLLVENDRDRVIGEEGGDAVAVLSSSSAGAAAGGEGGGVGGAILYPHSDGPRPAGARYYLGRRVIPFEAGAENATKYDATRCCYATNSGGGRDIWSRRDGARSEAERYSNTRSSNSVVASGGIAPFGSVPRGRYLREYADGRQLTPIEPHQMAMNWNRREGNNDEDAQAKRMRLAREHARSEEEHGIEAGRTFRYVLPPSNQQKSSSSSSSSDLVVAASYPSPFYLPQLQTIFGTSDEYAIRGATSQFISQWVWGGAEAIPTIKGDPLLPQLLSSSSSLLSSSPPPVVGSTTTSTKHKSEDYFAFFRQKRRFLIQQQQRRRNQRARLGDEFGDTNEQQEPLHIFQPFNFTDTFLSHPLFRGPRTGRTYLKQYSHSHLRRQTYGDRMGMDQPMLLFRGYAAGIMTMGRVTGRDSDLGLDDHDSKENGGGGGGGGPVGYWGAASAINGGARAKRWGTPLPSTDTSTAQRQPHSASAVLSPSSVDDRSLVSLLPNGKKYLWSFIGVIKSDREEMRDEFGNMSVRLNLPFFCCGAPTVESHYTQSLFVPVGRGFVALDCFRIYEALAGGAIPVIVAAKFIDLSAQFLTFFGLRGPFYSETASVSAVTTNAATAESHHHHHHHHEEQKSALLQRYLGYDAKNESQRVDLTVLDHLPPFIYAETWAKAAAVVERLVGEDAEVRRLRRQRKEKGGRQKDNTNVQGNVQGPSFSSLSALERHQRLCNEWFMNMYWLMQDRIVFGRRIGEF